MNKTKMTLAVIGGVMGLLVLGMAYFTWSAFSAKTAAIEGDDEEGTDGLETVVSKAQTLSRKPVYPCAASLKAIESNQTLVAEWRAEARKLASRGDRVYEKTTPATFKTFLVADAKRLTALPGRVNGALAQPEFAFGPFKDYISEGKMPAEAQLAELQRRWDDIATVVEMLATSGIAELTDVQFGAGADTEKKDEKEDRNRRNNRKSRKPEKKAAGDSLAPRAFSYVFKFNAKPSAFVKVINALETSERFITVDGFTFSHERDVIAAALGGDDERKGEAAAGGGRRGRRGRRAHAAEPTPQEVADAAAAKSGIVTDPQLDPPFAVTLSLTVHDFRSLEEESGAADAGASEKKGASK